MTFGEKLRDARKKAGISQEELAEKLSVSRSAVAKWETDNGLPDVGNLKAMAAVLNVSIDYLLAEDERLTFNEIRKPIELANYQKTGKCRSNKDAAVYGEYQDAKAIWPLIRKKKLNRGEFLLDLFTAWGASQLVDYANNSDAYYLVDKGDRQYLVRVAEDYMTVSELAVRIEKRKFEIGSNIFIKAGYQLI